MIVMSSNITEIVHVDNKGANNEGGYLGDFTDSDT
jgi:hypothetical protein